MIIVRARPSPFEVMFMVAAILGGAAILALRQRLGTPLATQLPLVINLLLGISLVLGGATVLTGLLSRTLFGELMQRAGLVVLALMMLVYSGFTLNLVGIRGSVTALFFVSFAAACVWRAWQIGRELGEVQDVLSREVTGPDDRGS